MPYRELIARTYTTLDPHKQETMHAMVAARYVYRAWELDLIGARDPAAEQALLPLAQAVKDRQAYISAPAMLYAATTEDYDAKKLAAIPADAPPNAVLGGLLIDGDHLSVEALSVPELVESCIIQSVAMAAGLSARGMSTDNPALMALEAPFTWERTARLVTAPPTQGAMSVGDGLSQWHAEWCARAYIAAREGEALPEVSDAPPVE